MIPKAPKKGDENSHMRSGPPCHLITHFRLLAASASGKNPTSVNKVSVRSMALNQTIKYSRAQAIKNRHQMTLQSSWLHNRGPYGKVARGRSCDYDVSEYLFGASRNQVVGAFSGAQLLLDLDQQVEPVNHQLNQLALHKKEQIHYFLNFFKKSVIWAKSSVF